MQGVPSFNTKAFMPERVNAEISKRYDIDKREIGVGGYGKVFVAQDREMRGRRVAIKKELDHPNICKLLETYEQGRFMFFVMEYCEGGEVFDRIMDVGMIEEVMCADIVKQCASALKYAHNRGIAHRDMKPENICFCSTNIENNHVKIIDWGLGFYFGEARMKSAVGSLTYAAPEVLEAKGVEGYSCSCDLWSLGVVTYVALCGKPPFWGNHTEQLRRMKKEQYPMTDQTWQGISKEAKALIKGLLRCNPKDRLSTTAVLAHPWLKMGGQMTDPAIGRQVLANMRQFSQASRFFSLCVASVARQLDHSSLRDVHRVFTELDTNGDGVLDVNEVRIGFERMFGKDSEQARQVDEMFARLDMDGSGTLDYTEFCAAGIGQRLSTQEHVLWAAFKTFDVEDDDGRVTKDEIKSVLLKADVNKFWTNEICDELATELFARYDSDGDGSLDFDEWMSLMREISSSKAYDLLSSADRVDSHGLADVQAQEASTVGNDEKPQSSLLRNADTSASPNRKDGRELRTISGTLVAANYLKNNTPDWCSCGPAGQKAKSPKSDAKKDCSIM